MISTRRTDLPALRAKAATAEGQAILKRLRFLLDGAAGETMTTHFNPARSMQESNAEPRPGTLTFGHTPSAARARVAARPSFTRARARVCTAM